MPGPETLKVQTTVIGSGLAGMAAALFGVQNSMQTALVGGTGASAFSSGLLDLLGVLPTEPPRICSDPWEAIDRLADICPGHPYTLMHPEDIDQALTRFVAELENQGLYYAGEDRSNVLAIGPVGTRKPTYLLPWSMMTGVREMAKGSPGMIVDINGLKDFSASLVASNLKPVWPDLRTANLTFPGTESRAEVFTALLAQSLESPEVREQLIHSLQALTKDVQVLGLPAVLGLGSAQAIHQELESRLQVKIFEIPTLPASVPALRLHEAVKRCIEQSSLLHSFDQYQVTSVHRDDQGWFHVRAQGPMHTCLLKSRTVLLATGRFLGQGLQADRKGIRESVFDLPVHQPAQRAQWHREDFFHPQGHPISGAGLEVDEFFRPIDAQGKTVYANLYAAGSILAHQDWMRMKCGAGVAIASAYKAISSIQ
ncbi:MAG: glycerol-3-phosphate dehydrogenase subunit GlpB [Desulfovermiculus sp.]|nr:glycerol-3-phosphate dehydrogenase subunit GlpB [Desulfovermiculus sp.]